MFGVCEFFMCWVEDFFHLQKSSWNKLLYFVRHMHVHTCTNTPTSHSFAIYMWILIVCSLAWASHIAGPHKVVYLHERKDRFQTDRCVLTRSWLSSGLDVGLLTVQTDFRPHPSSAQEMICPGSWSYIHWPKHPTEHTDVLPWRCTPENIEDIIRQVNNLLD